jgi:hypothetical protein
MAAAVAVVATEVPHQLELLHVVVDSEKLEVAAQLLVLKTSVVAVVEKVLIVVTPAEMVDQESS